MINLGPGITLTLLFDDVFEKVVHFHICFLEYFIAPFFLLYFDVQVTVSGDCAEEKAEEEKEK